MGLNKLAHEWLGWVLVAAVALHLTVNFRGLKMQLSQPRGQGLAGLFVVVLGLSFIPASEEGGGKAAFMAISQALATAPLPVVAQVVGVSDTELASRLTAAGYPPDEATSSITTLVGKDPQASAGLIARVLKPAP